MTEKPFDPTHYSRSPMITIASGISLARALAAAAPKKSPKLVLETLQTLTAAADAAQKALADRQRGVASAPTDESSRAIDNVADVAWAALHERIHAYAMLPETSYPLAAKAQVLVQTLFGQTGLTFLKASYASQLQSMDGILRRIDEDGLATTIDQVAGPEFLAGVRAIQPRYAKMVQDSLTRDSAPQDNLKEHRVALQDAIADYTAKIIGNTDRKDPKSVTIARKALLPIDNHREQTARRGKPDDPTGPTDSAESNATNKAAAGGTPKNR